MAKEFRFPDLGEGVTEGEIKKWLVMEGDQVRKDQPLAEVETDKAVVEMPSPYSGRVLKLNHLEGGIVKVGEVLATIGEEGEVVAAAEPPSSTSVVGELPESEEVVSTRPAPAPGVQATPAVRKLAKDIGVDIASVRGTGPQGRVIEEDVRNASGAAPPAPVPPGPAAPAQAPSVTTPSVKAKFDLYGWVDRKPLRGIRRSTAKHMMEARNNAALVTTMEVVDVTDLVALREKVNRRAQESKRVKLTYLPFIIKAVIACLKKHPYMNSSMDEEAEEIVIKKYYNLGIAVATEDGLIVPVVKAADQKDLFTLAKELKDLAEAASNRKIDLADLKGGTFSITNYGVFGSTYATPIPNYPEAAILGVGRIHDAPMVRDGAVVARKAMHLALTFDHRLMDGAQAASFLTDLRQLLESPELILLDL